MGFKEFEYIGKIIVDLCDFCIVYVVVIGLFWSSGGECGVYKIIDGG